MRKLINRFKVFFLNRKYLKMGIVIPLKCVTSTNELKDSIETLEKIEALISEVRSWEVDRVWNSTKVKKKQREAETLFLSLKENVKCESDMFDLMYFTNREISRKRYISHDVHNRIKSHWEPF